MYMDVDITHSARLRCHTHLWPSLECYKYTYTINLNLCDASISTPILSPLLVFGNTGLRTLGFGVCIGVLIFKRLDQLEQECRKT